MSWHNVIGAILALAVMSSPALACKGGEELASDDFTDGTAWTDAPEASFGSGKLSLKPKPDQYAWVFWNNGYFDDADVCVDITYPSAKNPDGGVLGGLIFWWQPESNNVAYMLWTTPAGLVGVERREMKTGKVTTALPKRSNPAIKKGAGATNTWRITLKGNTATLYANDAKIAAFKGTGLVGGDRLMGLYGLSTSDENNSTWVFSNFKVTDVK
jgi:hypothetical protein